MRAPGCRIMLLRRSSTCISSSLCFSSRFSSSSVASLTSNSITVRWERGGVEKREGGEGGREGEEKRGRGEERRGEERRGEVRRGEERRGEERRGEEWEAEGGKQRGGKRKGEEKRERGREKLLSKQHHSSNLASYARSSVRKSSNVSMQFPLVHQTTYLGHCCPGLKVAAHHHYVRE